MRHHSCVFRFDPLPPINRLRSVLSAPLLLLPLLFSGSVAMAQSSGKAPSAPASNDDIFLYRGMGSSYVCNARAAKVEFPKAVGIAAATYVQLLNGRHGGLVASTGNKKLTNEQLFAGAEFQIITGALQFCPDMVPADVKSKVEEALKKQKAAN